MLSYEEYEDDPEFMEILEFLRGNCLAVEEEVADGTDLDWDVIRKHYRFAQAIVADEINHGIVHDPDGAALARGFMDYLAGEFGDDDDEVDDDGAEENDAAANEGTNSSEVNAQI